MTSPSYYPLYFELEKKLCVVVGGGKVAERKVRALLAARARVRAISPETTQGLAGLAKSGRIELIPREYRDGDLQGAALAFAATDSAETNAHLRQEADRSSIPLNVADNPDLCDFIVPSIVRKGPIIIAIATSGLLPMLSKKLRQEVLGKLSSDFVVYARRVGAFRRYVLTHVENGGERRRIMRNVARQDVVTVAGMTLKEMKEKFL